MKRPSFTKHVKRPNCSIERLGRFFVVVSSRFMLGEGGFLTRRGRNQCLAWQETTPAAM